MARTKGNRQRVRSEGHTAMTPPELNTYRNGLGASRRGSPRYDTEHALSASRNAAGGNVAPSETAKTYAPRALPRESKRARWSADFTVMTARTGNDWPEGSKAMTLPKPALPADQGAPPPGHDNYD